MNEDIYGEGPEGDEAPFLEHWTADRALTDDEVQEVRAFADSYDDERHDTLCLAVVPWLNNRIRDLEAFARRVAAEPSKDTPYVAWDMREQAAKVLGEEKE